MKVYELAALRGVNAKDLAKELNLKSHLSVVSDELMAKFPATVEKEKPSFIEKPVIGRPKITDEEKLKSIKGLGVKSRFWKERETLGLK